MQRPRRVARQGGSQPLSITDSHTRRLEGFVSMNAEKPETVNAAHLPAQVSSLAYGAVARPRC
jgi:hypothetical protein